MKNFLNLTILLIFSFQLAFCQESESDSKDEDTPKETTNQLVSVINKENEVDTTMNITVFGQGNLIQSISKLTEIPGTIGLGILLKKYIPRGKVFEKYNLSLVFNVASNVDSIKYINDSNSIRGFGTSLLVPTQAKQSVGISGKVYFANWKNGRNIGELTDDEMKRGLGSKKVFSGLYWNINASNRFWSKSDSVMKGSEKEFKNVSKHGGIFGLNVGLIHELTSKNWIEKDFSIFWGLGFIGRGLIGDLAQNEESTRKEREFFLTNGTRFYGGVEAKLSVQIKDFKLEACLPYIFKGGKNNVHVPGLTGLQFVPSISFIGGFGVRQN